MCSHTADSADVRARSPASKSLVTLRNRSLANCGERAAEVWGSRGRRFKSCHPDGKQQVRGRFGQNPRRPLCCRVAIGVATAHVLTSPLLLRAAGPRSAPSVETAARRYAVARPPRAGARLLRYLAQDQCPAKSVLQRGQTDTVHSQSLDTSDRPQCLLGLTAVPFSVVKTRPVSAQIEAALSRSTAWLAMTDRNSAAVAGERDMSRRERPVLGSLMTRCPLTRKSVPRTRSRVRPSQGGVHPGSGVWERAGAAVAHKRPRQWTGSALLSSAHLPFDSGCRVAGEQFVPHRRLKFAMASMGTSETKVSELCQEFGISRQTFYRDVSANGEACPDGERVLSLESRDGLCHRTL